MLFVRCPWIVAHLLRKNIISSVACQLAHSSLSISHICRFYIFFLNSIPYSILIHVHAFAQKCSIRCCVLCRCDFSSNSLIRRHRKFQLFTCVSVIVLPANVCTHRCCACVSNKAPPSMIFFLFRFSYNT